MACWIWRTIALITRFGTRGGLFRPPVRAALAASGLVAVGLAASSAWAQGTGADLDNIVTLQVENDATSTQTGTSDRYYTSGLRAGWTSGVDAVGFASTLGHVMFGEGTTRLSLEVSQSLYTPRDTQIAPPDPNDRPYAGVLVATAGLVHDTAWTRDIGSLSLGVVGPAALGRQVQNGFHDIIGDTPNRGWHYQIQDQPAFQILRQRTWRLPVATLGALETDALPSATVSLGDIRAYAQAGAVLRIGQGLASDFGASRIAPGLNGADAYTNVRPFAWYLFAGGDGQAVGYDVSLDGSTFRNASPSVGSKWDVGEFEAGAAVLWHGLRLSYTQTWQTESFRHAKAGLFNFGSLALSAKF